MGTTAMDGADIARQLEMEAAAMEQEEQVLFPSALFLLLSFSLLIPSPLVSYFFQLIFFYSANATNTAI